MLCVEDETLARARIDQSRPCPFHGSESEAQVCLALHGGAVGRVRFHRSESSARDSMSLTDGEKGADGFDRMIYATLHALSGARCIHMHRVTASEKGIGLSM